MKRSLGTYLAVMLASITIVLISGASAGARSQLEEREPNIEFAHSTTSTGFGDGWAINYQCDPCTEDTTTVTLTGFPSGYSADRGSSEPDEFVEGWIRADINAAPLPAGTYTVTVDVDYESWDHTTRWVGSKSKQLTITRAEIGGTLTAAADPKAPSNLILTAELTGFLPGWSTYYGQGIAVLPDGSWIFSVTDESGREVFTKSVDMNDRQSPFVASAYWMDAEPGLEYLVSAKYEVGGAASDSVKMSQPTAVAIVGPANSRPPAVSTADPAPDQLAVANPSEFQLPTIALIALIILIVGLGTLVGSFAVRRARGLALQTGGEASDGEEAVDE